jgi:hypothetical protein
MSEYYGGHPYDEAIDETELTLVALPAVGQWKLLNRLEVLDDHAHSFYVPAGFITDLASLPRPLRGVFNRNGRSRKPAVLHDYLYSEKMFTRKKCDLIFKDCLVNAGISKFAARLYYYGVRSGGWTRGRW